MRMSGTKAGQAARRSRTWTAVSPTAALASLGAGAIHATAVGAHGEHRQAAIAFAVTAVFQIAWGAIALVRSNGWVAWSGLVGNGAAVGGWVLAKASGIPFVAGLEAAESVQFADAAAAGLAAVAVLGALTCLVDPAGSPPLGRAARVPAAAGLALLVVVAMVATGGHSHTDHSHTSAHGDGTAHDHGDEDAAGHSHTEDAGHDDHDLPAEGEHAHGSDAGGDDHAHDDPADSGHGRHDGTGPDHAPHDHDGGERPPDDDHDHDDEPGDHPGGGHGPNHPTPKPYDATLPVDLGGVPGVTAQQQASAEAVVTDAIVKLPQFADVATAEARGYHSFGDGFTGYEHFVNWSLLDDGRILDADYPESLVYRVDGGRRTLVSAMYFLETGTTLADVPDMGGPLVQWHIHNDLCVTGPDNSLRLVVTRPPSEACPVDSMRLEVPPMVHVWIVPHRCGPFAALEGASGGQVGEGETVRCDHAHGSA